MSTTVMSALAVIYNHDDRRILADFGKGAKVADIAGGLGISNERVLSVVNRINMNQSTAREAVRYYDKQMATSAGKAAIEKAAEDARWAEQVAAAKAKTTRKPKLAEPATPDADEDPAADAADEVVDSPVDNQGTAPEPVPEAEQDEPADTEPDSQPDNDDAPLDIEALLKEAETCGLKEHGRMAEAIRRHIADLNTAMAGIHEQRQVREAISALTQQINDLTQQRENEMNRLRELVGRSNVHVSASDLLTKAERTACREWAIAQGKHVGRAGRLPTEVIAEWREATRA